MFSWAWQKDFIDKADAAWPWKASVLSANNYALLFSEQQIIDCSAFAILAADAVSYTNAKCTSGNVGAAIAFNTRYNYAGVQTISSNVSRARAIALAGTYTNVGNASQSCKYSYSTSSRLYLHNKHKLSGADIDTITEMKTALDARQYATSIKSCTAFKQYTNGIFSTVDCATEDHAVHITGYTATSWEIKNSWGTAWGEKGFGHVLRKEKDTY